MAVVKKFNRQTVMNNKYANKFKAKAQAAQYKNNIAELSHKQKVNKLERQKLQNEIKAQKAAAKPKAVQKRIDRDFKLKQLEARREVDVINAKNRWKNTLAAGVTSTSTIDSLKNDDGKSIQKELEKVLAGSTDSSVKQGN